MSRNSAAGMVATATVAALVCRAAAVSVPVAEHTAIAAVVAVVASAVATIDVGSTAVAGVGVDTAAILDRVGCSVVQKAVVAGAAAPGIGGGYRWTAIAARSRHAQIALYVHSRDSSYHRTEAPVSPTQTLQSHLGPRRQR